MFAFAVWDRKKRRLLLARDRVGKKPLFYRTSGQKLWFASELNALLQDEEVARTPDYGAIDTFLRYLYVPAPDTAFVGIHKLPPAHTLSWHDGHAELKRYWRLSYRSGSVTRPEDAHERIREGLLEATRIRLRSDVPLGAFLSGGVDSSAVVAAMAQTSAHRVKTFSIGFDVDSYDETAYAREVAALFDTDHHELRVEPDAMEILPRLVWHYGEPFGDHSAIPSFYLSELTRQSVTVALNGDGGDESFAGYRRYAGNTVAASLERFPYPLRVAVASMARTIGPGPTIDGVRARLLRLSTSSLMKPWERYANWVGTFNDDERSALYTPEFRAALADRDTVDVIRAPWVASDAADLVNRLLDVDVQTYLPGDLLVKMDIASMAHSLEVRSPFLDHCFMEFAASLPGSMKVDGRVGKKVLKDALRPWLPDHILDRRKWGFGVPIGEWFRGRLRELPREVLLDDHAVARGMFDRRAVEKIISDHQNRARDNTDRIWALMQVELWLRTFVDARSAAPVTLAVA
jgi:asparagine synthase (glutamine-hydrolysing)